MKILFEFFPILLFFLAFKLWGIYVATGVAMAASLVQVIATRITQKKYDWMQVVTLVLIMIFGGATIILKNERFIEWKPTILYWIFALVFLVSHLSDKTLIERMMGSKITLPAHAWKKMSFSWIAFFTLTGALNIFVAYHFSTEIWVNFKLFGLLGLMILFVIGQSIFLSRHIKHEQ